LFCFRCSSQQSLKCGSEEEHCEFHGLKKHQWRHTQDSFIKTKDHLQNVMQRSRCIGHVVRTKKHRITITESIEGKDPEVARE